MAVDGESLADTSAVDESTATGESLSVAKTVGHPVIGATVTRPAPSPCGRPELDRRPARPRRRAVGARRRRAAARGRARRHRLGQPRRPRRQHSPRSHDAARGGRPTWPVRAYALVAEQPDPPRHRTGSRRQRSRVQEQSLDATLEPRMRTSTRATLLATGLAVILAAPAAHAKAEPQDVDAGPRRADPAAAAEVATLAWSVRRRHCRPRSRATRSSARSTRTSTSRTPSWGSSAPPIRPTSRAWGAATRTHGKVVFDYATGDVTWRMQRR